METKRTEVASIYFHIGNGGISFGVVQQARDSSPVMLRGQPVVLDKTPLLSVSAHHLGIETNNMEIPIRPEALTALGEMLIEAGKRVVFDGESQVVVENPHKVRFADGERLLGLPEEARCSESPAAAS